MADGKIAGIRYRWWIIVGVVAAGGAGIYLWRQRKAASSASSASAASTGCTDANGNPVACPEASGTDYSGELSVLQAEVESLLASQAADTSAETKDKDVPAVPSGVTTSAVTATSFRAAWKAVSGATSYGYQVSSGGKVVKTSPVTVATSVLVSGLHPKTAYTFQVRAHSASGWSAYSAGATVTTRASGGKG